VFRDGSFANRVGTSALAEAATELGVPVLVACETFKLAPFEAPGTPDNEWEDEEPFDLTTAEHVDRYVTDEGDFAPRTSRRSSTRRRFSRTAGRS
jgi:translation initiation factor 2B subunit (eIF-2B alpha/beta/delta family)